MLAGPWGWAARAAKREGRSLGRPAAVVGCEAGPRGMQHGPMGAGVGNVALQASREKKRWATGENKTERARLSGKRLPIFQIVFSYLVFNSKPTSNVNQIKFEYTFLIQIKIRNFGMLPKINFTKLKIHVFSNFLFFYFKAILNFFSKSILNVFNLNQTHSTK